jgi:hypothetical protein
MRDSSHIDILVCGFRPIKCLTERIDDIFWIEPLDALDDAFTLDDASPERRVSVLVITLVVETGEDVCLCRVRCKGFCEASGRCTKSLEGTVDKRGERVVKCATLCCGSRCGSHGSVGVVEERKRKSS